MLGFIGSLGGSELLLIFIFFAVCLLPLIASVVHLVRNEHLDSNMKIVWLLVIIFVPFGWLIYFIVGGKRKES